MKWILHYTIILCSLFFSWLSTFTFADSPTKNPPTVLVSVAPYVEFVKQLCGTEASVKLLVPPGASAHTFEPNAKQMAEASHAHIWFCIGEPFEEKFKKSLTQINPSMECVTLSEHVPLLYDTGSCSSCAHVTHSFDPHLWMSPKNMLIQIDVIARSLKAIFPNIASLVDKNAQKLHSELQQLDAEIRHLVNHSNQRVILVSHPSYGYFCHEYGLKQLSIEQEGKDPTPKQIDALIKQAQENSIHIIFTQRQYPTKAAELIAKVLGAHIMELDPYSAEYFMSMKKIAKALSELPPMD